MSVVNSPIDQLGTVLPSTLNSLDGDTKLVGNWIVLKLHTGLSIILNVKSVGVGGESDAQASILFTVNFYLMYNWYWVDMDAKDVWLNVTINLPELNDKVQPDRGVDEASVEVWNSTPFFKH